MPAPKPDLADISDRLEQALVYLREPCTPNDRMDARLVVEKARRALADALDQQAAVSGPPLRGALIEKVSYHSDPHDCPECQNNRWIYCHGHTPPPVLWEERVARAQEAVNDNDTKPDWLEIVLRAAFPELAPTDA